MNKSKKLQLSQLFRSDLMSLAGYTNTKKTAEVIPALPGKPVIKLDAGECTADVTSKLRSQMLQQLSSPNILARYPSSNYTELRQAIATYAEVEPNQIVLGNGSDELIDLLLRLTLNPNDEVVISSPTFSMYAISTKLNRGVLVDVPRLANFDLDLPALISACNQRTKVVFVCSPNNPTGNPVPLSQIEALLATNTLVVVDEAYIEFGGQTATSLLSVNQNLVILRTFSKWAGVAGLRLGYAIGNPEIIARLNQIRSPYNVSALANFAGISLLSNLDSARTYLVQLKQERKKLANELTKLPWMKVYPTVTNFAYLGLTTAVVPILQSVLAEQNIIVRWFSDTKASTIRVTIGTPAENVAFLRAIQIANLRLQNPDAILFDMDGVLIDVSQSYRRAIKLTAENWLSQKAGVQVTVTNELISAVKQLSGFNNDWDATYGVVTAYQQNWPPIALKSKLQPLKQKDRNTPEYRELFRIFQAYYLGDALYRKTYAEIPPVTATALIDREEPLISTELLQKLQAKFKLGIATGRPRLEALYALKKLGWLDTIFSRDCIVAKEDAPAEKPDPAPLIVAKALTKSTTPIYVGDSPSDLSAANAANIPIISIGQPTAGDCRLATTTQIQEVLL